MRGLSNSKTFNPPGLIYVQKYEKEGMMLASSTMKMLMLFESTENKYTINGSVKEVGQNLLNAHGRLRKQGRSCQCPRGHGELATWRQTRTGMRRSRRRVSQDRQQTCRRRLDCLKVRASARLIKRTEQVISTHSIPSVRLATRCRNALRSHIDLWAESTTARCRLQDTGS